MYIDFSIPICDGLPKVVLEEIEFLENAYKNEDDIAYLLREDSLESYLKDCRMQGLINDQQLDQMFRRFGWRY